MTTAVGTGSMACMSDAESNGEKAPGGITGKGFAPGQTGNAGGMPKWVTEARAAIRGNLWALAQRHLTRALGGSAPADSTPEEDALYKSVTVADRNVAARLVIEYSIPKPKQAVAAKLTGDCASLVVQVVQQPKEELDG